MGLLASISGLFGRSARAQTVVPPPDLAAQRGLELMSVFGAQPPRRGSAELLVAYREMPWLHAVVRRRAEAFAAIEWRLYRAKKGRARALRGFRAQRDRRETALPQLMREGLLEEVSDHDVLALLDKPNATHTGRAFWELFSTHLDLLGETFWGVDRHRGRPSALWPVVPTWVRRTPTPTSDTYEIQTPAGRNVVESKDMVWTRKLDPADPYAGRGVGTAGAIGDELQTDEYMAEMAKARFFNGANPSTLIAFPPQQGQPGTGLSKEQINELSIQFDAKHKGANKAGQVHFFNRDFKAQQLSHTMVEAQYVQARKLFRDFTLQVFGTPPEIQGVLENANRSTIDAAEHLFMKLGITPVAELARAELQTAIVSEWGEDLWLDYSDIVPDDRDMKARIMIALPSAFKLNQILALAGEPPIPGEKGEEFYVAPGAPRIPIEGDVPKALPEKKNDVVEEKPDAVENENVT